METLKVAIREPQTFIKINVKEGGIPGKDGKNTGLSKSISIPFVQDTDDITLFFTEKELEINSVVAVLKGDNSPQVSYSINCGIQRNVVDKQIISNDSVSSITVGDIGIINDNLIPTNNFTWIKIESVSGNVNEFHLTIFYTEK